MTVSRALGDHPNVTKETREAVQKRAQEVGYVRSAAARVMRGDGTNIVGLLLPNITNEFYAHFANSLANECDAVGQQLIIHLTDDDLNKENEAVNRLQQVQADTVIMVPCPTRGEVSATPVRNMRVIQLIRTRVVEGGCSSVLVDDASALSGAVAHLAGLGHRDIAYLGANLSMSSGRNRYDAYARGMKAAGLPLKDDHIHTGAPSFEMGVAAAREVLQHTNATAMICGGFEISNGALKMILSKGQATSDRISFVGYGDSPLNKWVNGGITTISIPVQDMANEAAKLLAGPPPNLTDGKGQHLLSAKLLIRNSTKRPSPAT